jgi:hypothetical protein
LFYDRAAKDTQQVNNVDTETQKDTAQVNSLDTADTKDTEDSTENGVYEFCAVGSISELPPTRLFASGAFHQHVLVNSSVSFVSSVL